MYKLLYKIYKLFINFRLSGDIKITYSLLVYFYTILIKNEFSINRNINKNIYIQYTCYIIFALQFFSLSIATGNTFNNIII